MGKNVFVATGSSPKCPLGLCEVQASGWRLLCCPNSGSLVEMPQKKQNSCNPIETPKILERPLVTFKVTHASAHMENICGDMESKTAYTYEIHAGMQQTETLPSLSKEISDEQSTPHGDCKRDGPLKKDLCRPVVLLLKGGTPTRISRTVLQN